MNGAPAQARQPALDVRHPVVIGLGASGLAAVRLLRACGVDAGVLARGDSAEAVDAARAFGARVIDDGSLPRDTDVLVPSPGIPEHDPVVAQAQQLGIAVWSEPELAARATDRTLLAITGTNGKTTTTELVAAMLDASGISAQACGNIGLPVCDAVLDTTTDTVLIAELSSFQLRFVSTMRATIGAILNVAPDHLDWHGDLAAYASAKARIWTAQTDEDWALANRDDPTTLALQRSSAPGRHAQFSATRRVETGVGVVDAWLVATSERGDEPIVALETLPVRGSHHLANIAAAACMAWLHGARPDALAAAARELRPGRHRGDVVGVVDDITYIDDSKATNPHAAAAALGAHGPTVWIAGGRAKGVDLSGLADHLHNVRQALLIGEATDELEAICAGAGVATHRCEDLDTAVAAAVAAAQRGDTVLLAPACASFDQFRDYRERGRVFADAVRRHAGASAGRVRTDAP